MESFSVDELDELKPVESFLIPTDDFEVSSEADHELNDFSEETELEKIREAFLITECEVEEDLLNISKVNYAARLAEVLPSARITSIAASESYLILGTNLSDVLVFAQSDFEHLGTISNAKGNADVSALDISHDQRRLLIGFAKGQVFMYDLGNFKQLRKLPSDCHAIRTARVQLLSFTNEQNIQGICSDSSSVSMLEFTKIITKRSTDVFQLVKGEMVNPPRIFQSYEATSPLYRRPLMAVLTPQKLIARPISKTLENSDFELSFPHLTRHHNALYASWHLGEENDPELILGHNQQITIFRFAQFAQWVVLRSIQLDEIVSFVSIVPQTSLKLVLASPDCTPPYKLYIYNDESPTPMYNKICDENISLKSFSPYVTNSNILFQDKMGDLFSVRMRDWNERIVKIKNKNSMKEAVKFVLSLATGQIKGVIGLGDAFKAQSNIKSALVKLLPKLIEKELKNCENDDYSIATFVLAACVRSDLHEFLSESIGAAEQPVASIVELFAQKGNSSRDVFFTALQDIVKIGEFTAIRPSLLSQLIAWMDEKGKISEFTKLIRCVDRESLNVNELLRLFKEHGCWEGRIILYNYVLENFEEPLQFVLESSDPPSSLLSATNKYLSCCLKGVEYPSKAPLDQPEKVREKVFTLLLMEYVSSERNYPLLRILLKTMGIKLFKSLGDSIEYLRDQEAQKLIDVLLKLTSIVGKRERELVLLFLGQQIAKNAKIHVDKLQIDEIVDFLTNKSGDNMEERERICELLYDSGKLNQMTPKRIQRLMIKTKFYRIAHKIAFKNEDYVSAMMALEKFEKPREIVRYIERVMSSLTYDGDFKAKVLTRLSLLFGEVPSEVVTLCITYYGEELAAIASNLSDDALHDFFRECFLPTRELPRNSPFFLQYIKHLIDSNASELIDVLTESDFDTALIEPVLVTSSNKSAKAVLYEKAQNYEKTSEILLSQLRHDSSKFSKNLDIFLAFVQRTSSLVPPSDRERLFLAVFDIFNDMEIEDLQVYLPRAFCGLLGHVPMSKTVQAFIAFFNSSTFDDVPFGPMKQLVTSILDSTTRDVTNLVQMSRISESGRFAQQAELAQTRRRAIVGGLPGATCALSGDDLGKNSRVLFREGSQEYSFDAIKLDPEEHPSQSIYGQRHRKLFHEEGLSYELGDSVTQETPQIEAAYKFLHYQFSSIR